MNESVTSDVVLGPAERCSWQRWSTAGWTKDFRGMLINCCLINSLFEHIVIVITDLVHLQDKHVYRRHFVLCRRLVGVIWLGTLIPKLIHPIENYLVIT